MVFVEETIRQPDDGAEVQYWQKEAEYWQQKYNQLLVNMTELLQAENATLKQHLAAAEAKPKAADTTDVAEVAEPAVDAAKAKLLASNFYETLDLETRTAKFLARGGFVTVGALCRCNARTLLEDVRNFGPACLNDLNYKLWRHGLWLAPDEWRYQRKMKEILKPSAARLLDLAEEGMSDAACERLKQLIRTCDRWNEMLYYTEARARRFFSESAPELADEFVTQVRKLGFEFKTEAMIAQENADD